VDDDMRNIFALTYVLENRKIKVVVANDGREALEMIKIHPDLDAVLLDMMMPVMDGYETATIIRANPDLDQLPVIALTANAMKGDREKCIAAGANDYLTKPVNTEDVMNTLSRCIKLNKNAELTI
jgi:CheY-like chemotaxis protein